VSSSNVTTKLIREVYDDVVVDRKRNNLWMTACVRRLRRNGKRLQ